MMTEKNQKIILIILLVLLIGYGFFLRVYELGEQSYWIDEGYTLNAVLSTLEKGYPVLDSGRHYSRALLNTYLISAATKIGGFNPWTTRMIAVIFGTAFIFLIYKFTKKIFNQKVGLLTAVLVTFSYWEIAWSRQARMYIQLQFFFFLSLYLFWLLLEKFSYKRLAVLIIATIGAILSHKFGWLLLGIYFLTYLVKELGPFILKKILKKKSPNPWKKAIHQLGKFSKKVRIVLFAVSLAVLLFSLYKIIILAKANLFNYSFYIGNAYQDFLLSNMPIIFIGALLGLMLAILKEKNILKVFFLAICYILPYFVITFSTDLVHYRYIFFILPVLFIFLSYFIYSLATHFHPAFIGPLLLIIIIMLFSVRLNASAFTFSPQTHYWLESHTPQPDFKTAYEQIKKQGWDDNKIIISPFTQMDKVYLGKSDYWLPISLTGKKKQLSAQLVDINKEIYTGSKIIWQVSALKKIIATNPGQVFLILDDMSTIRLQPPIRQFLFENNDKIIWKDTDKYWSRIWLFQF